MRRVSLFRTIETLLHWKRRLMMTKPPVVPDLPPVAPDPVVDDLAALEAEMDASSAVAVPLHALDTAPINSKIVVVRDAGVSTIILALPSGEQVILGGDDIASGLPAGAKIQKTAEGEFLARQLGGNDALPALVTATAHEAITRFVPHFHGQ